MNYLGNFVGSLLAGALLEESGFDIICCSFIVFYSLCVLVTALLMCESTPAIRHQSETDVLGLGEAKKTNTNVKSKIPFRWELVKESIGVCKRMALTSQLKCIAR